MVRETKSHETANVVPHGRPHHLPLKHFFLSVIRHASPSSPNPTIFIPYYGANL